MAEERFLGGTCVNVGCIPKKLFSYGAHFAEDFHDAAAYGWTVPKPSLRWKTLIDNKNKEIERLNGIYRNLLKGAGCTLYEARATIRDAHTLDVGGKTVTWPALHALLRRAADSKREEPPVSPAAVSIVLRLDRTTPWGIAQVIMMACAQPEVRAYKIHFAVLPETGDEEGSLAAHLPFDKGLPPDRDESLKESVYLPVVGRIDLGGHLADLPEGPGIALLDAGT